MTDRFLTAISGGEPDHGWSLVHPDTQASLFGSDPDRYADLVKASDWSNFRWRSLGGNWEESYLFFATYEFPAEIGSVPDVLTSSLVPGHGPLMHLDAASHIAEIMARSGPDGSMRVWASP